MHSPTLAWNRYVGDILVVANPMEDLGFVDEAHMRMYKDKKLGDPMVRCFR